MKTEKTIPYKIYLDEQEMPKKWYNVRADMKNKPAPLLNPGTLQPMTAEELGAVFCDELVQQELIAILLTSTSRRKFWIFIKCTDHLLWFVHIVWKKNCRHPQKFITNSRATTPVVAIS